MGYLRSLVGIFTTYYEMLVVSISLVEFVLVRFFCVLSSYCFCGFRLDT